MGSKLQADNNYKPDRARHKNTAASPHRGKGFDPKGRVRLIADIEANGFLDTVTTIHSICLFDEGAGEMYSGVPAEHLETYKASEEGKNATKNGVRIITLEAALEMLACANEIVGHNFAKYDYPVLRKVYPDWDIQGFITDTLILSRLIHINLKDRDFRLFQEGKVVGGNIGRHSLDAWGERLGTWKGEYTTLPVHAYRTAEEHGFTVAREENGGYVVRHGEDEWRGSDPVITLRVAFRKVGVSEEPFAHWCPEMQAYCDQDVVVTKSLWDTLKDEEYPQAPIDLEHRIIPPLVHSEECGFIFDMEKAQRLLPILLAEKAQIEADLMDAFDDWYEPAKWEEMDGATTTIPKTRYVKSTHDGVRNIKVRRFGANGRELKPYIGPPKILYEEGSVYTPVVRKSFDPGSRDRVAKVLQRKYNWKPETFTKTGQPEISDDTLKGLKQYPECQLLSRYFTLVKRLGQLAEGQNAWLKHYKLQGNGLYTLATRYNPTGTVTFRSSHYEPNLAQVPAASESVPFGPEFRELFTVPPGWVLLGTDLEGLENNVLGHYLARYDDGAYLEVCRSGDSHWHNVQAMGMVPPGTPKDPENSLHKVYRNKIAKTLWYAFIYGCAAEKAGSIYTEHLPLSREEIMRLTTQKRHEWIVKWMKRKGKKLTRASVAKVAKGSELLEGLLEGMPALNALIAKLQNRRKTTELSAYGPHIKALDGRRIHCRSDHSLLNALGQSSGAVICKEWLASVWEECLAQGLKPGWNGDFVICAWVHDELQIACRNQETAELLARIAKQAAEGVGPKFKFRGVTAADATIGANWKETH